LSTLGQFRFAGSGGPGKQHRYRRYRYRWPLISGSHPQSQGANGCWQAGGVRIEKTSSGWRLQPYDYAYNSDAMCTMALVDFHHQVKIDFTRPGQTEVEIVKGSWTDDSTSTEKHQVVVVVVAAE
jgi:hypothetical protein